MTINDMRLYILQTYPKGTAKWREKVTNMPTAQVIAIYKSIKEREAKKKTDAEYYNDGYHQIDIYEYLAMKQEKGSHTQIAL